MHQLSAVEQLRLLRDNQLSSRELTEHYLGRIDQHGEALGAFTSVFHEQALEAADASDAAESATGPLHGLPLLLKDLHPTAGLRTTMGSAALKEWVPTADAPVMGALRASGAVILGKTNAPEFGPVCYTETFAGVAVTPYDTALSASGSSGGSAAAVAAGLAPFAHASDGLGSIRTPAANCGLVGVKPSRGRLIGSGGEWIALAVEGPVARSVADAAVLLDAIGPPDDGAIWQLAAWPPGAHQRAAAEPWTDRLRIGVLVDPGITTTVDPQCLQAVSLTRQALEHLGHELVEIPAGPSLEALQPAILVMLQSRLSASVPALVPVERQHLLMPFTRFLLENGPTLTGTEFAQAMTQLALATSEWMRLLHRYDVVLTPTTTAPPTPVGSLRLDDAVESAHAMLRWSAFTPWANFSGAPCISLPVHHTSEGVPLGVQISAPPGRDELLLSLAAALEPAFGWQDRHPVAFW